MKKIKYGSRDKTKQKKNPYIESLKDNDDDVCGAVLDSFSNDYLSYISGLVKAAKTPSKTKTQQRIEGLFQNNQQKSINFLLKNQPINTVNVVNKTKSKQVSPASNRSNADIKNTTLPMKKMKGIIEDKQAGQIKRQRQKSMGQVGSKMQSFNPLKISKTYALKEHYNRFPTQGAQTSIRENKYDQTSIACSDLSPRAYEQNVVQQQHVDPVDTQGKKFLDGLNDYLITLQSQRNQGRYDMKKNSKFKIDEDIKTIEQVYQQNIKLRKKIKKYQQKMSEIEQNMENHFIHCKRQEKSHKTKINDLTKALLRAISKVNQQKQQVDFMRGQLKSFGRKAQYCAQRYDDQSSEQQSDMHESIMKAMRPTRATSEYKLKRKLNIPFLNLASKDDS